VANHRRQRRFDGLACGKSVQYAGHSASLNRRSPRSGQADGRLERIHVLVSYLAQAQKAQNVRPPRVSTQELRGVAPCLRMPRRRRGMCTSQT
jgi:hypothetical protein